MNEDTENLLRECTSGCKMALESMEQVEEFTEDDELRKVLDKYKNKHDSIDREAEKMLEAAGSDRKKPNPMATSFSWITTEMKMKFNNNNHQIAKIMMDGCNMGIQTISERINQFQTADKEAKEMAERLVKTEEDFMVELEQFI